MFSLVRTLPSPTSAEGGPSLFGWFIRTVVQSDSSIACMSGVRLFTFPDRSQSWLGRDALEVSRFSCMLFLSVRGFLDYAEPKHHWRYNAILRVAFPLRRQGRHPVQAFFEAQ